MISLSRPVASPGSDAAAIVASLGDPEAFGEVFERHYPAVHRHLARRLGAHLADELAAEAFAVAFAKRRRYDDAYPDARPWLLGIATRLARHDWIAIDGYRGFRTRGAGPVRFVGPRDRARWEAAGKPELFAHGPSGRMHRDRPPLGSELARKPFYDGSEQVSYRQLLDLPRNPAALHARLRRTAVECACGQSVEQETIVIVGDLMRDTPIPGDLRAALLRAAALVPGIDRIERIRDVAGRTGTGVAIDSGGTRSVLIFDSESYELLGESEFVLRRNDYVDAGPGELVSGSAIMATGIVDSPTTVP